MSYNHVAAHLFGNSHSPLNLVWNEQTDHVQVFLGEHPEPLTDMTWEEFIRALRFLSYARYKAQEGAQNE